MDYGINFQHMPLNFVGSFCLIIFVCRFWLYIRQLFRNARKLINAKGLIIGFIHAIEGFP